MTRLVIGVIGHVDHGKTALVRALTGQETDRLPEEKDRGISIALGFAFLPLADGSVADLIDMPGHERFVRTMIAGATGIDAVLLIVAANEGVKPQTVEHVEIAAALGITRAVVVISKSDLADAEGLQRVVDETSTLLARSGLRSSPPVVTSVVRGTGLAELRGALEALAVDHQSPTADGIVYLPIDRAFSMSGHGAVVTGTLRGAPIAVGDTLELLPSRQRVRVRALQSNGVRLMTAAPGQRVAVNLRDIQVAQLERGMALSIPDALDLSDWITISIGSVVSAPALRNGVRLRALLGTDELDVRLRLLDRDVLHPGENGFAQLHGTRAMALPVTERIVLRLASPARTVAGGKLLESSGHRRPRHRPEQTEWLQQRLVMSSDQLIASEITRAGQTGVTAGTLSQMTALSLQRVTQLLQTLPVAVTRSGLVLAQSQMDALLARVPAVLKSHPDGLTGERLLEKLAGVSAAMLDDVVGLLLTRGVVSKRGTQLVLPAPAADQARTRSEAHLAATIAEKMRRGGLTPPTPAEVIKDLNCKRAIDQLLREGVLVRAVDRAKGREIFFHREAIECARRLLEPLLNRAPGMLVTDIGAALGISRKYSMPLLDHLDAIRFTRRVNDRRIRGVR
jgi:selenocysteine-specific elongation factor